MSSTGGRVPSGTTKTKGGGRVSARTSAYKPQAGVPPAHGRSTLASKPKASIRALQPVDTNLSAHARTDPFAALTTLRRLLSALPSRLGGCQYRLSPDEHRLAVHLLGIVEPFVHVSPPNCACAPRRTLVRLPMEILDAIAFWVDGRRDLAALAGTCRRLRDVVVPRHSEYRLVRCKPSAVRVWHHLVVHRGLARNVRRLEILDERASGEQEVVPAGIQTTETDLESTDDELEMHAKQERLLLAALGKMTALKSVKWSCNHSLVAFERVWPALVKCGSIEEVDVHDNLVFQAAGPSGDEATVPSAKAQKGGQMVLHELRTAGFHGTKTAFGASKEPDLGRISSMIHHCPNLEALTVSYVTRRSPGFSSPVADDFLLCGRWTHLRSLTLTNVWCAPGAGLDAAAAFLLAHVNLEVLHLDVAFGTGQAGGAALSTFKLPPGSLPCLKELKASRDFATALLSCSTGSPAGRPLDTLKGVRLTGSARDRIFLENLKIHAGQTLRHLELGGWHDMDDIRKLAECVPRLTWLDLGKKEGSASNGIGPAGKQAAANGASNFTEWTEVLEQFTELTTFHGIRFFYEVTLTDNGAALSLSDRSRVRKNEEVASVLAWKCPKLRRLDHWEEGTNKVIVLVRNAEGVHHEVRRVKV
ncbi:hypothetical protein OH77DRAFT_1418164 [Trametes cingulata]|nr:hypothetical protein OH77DRAFT_1418164 [Trametes cingulata]